jgi:hypothetical protein
MGPLAVEVQGTRSHPSTTVTLSEWTKLFDLRMETDPVAKMLCSVQNTR